MAGTIVIHTERCKGCGLCVSACPQQCISIATAPNGLGYFPAEPSIETSGQCTGCAICATVCPDVAITVYRDEPAGAVTDSKSSKK